MEDGGDWKDEKDEPGEAPDSWTPLLAVFVAVFAFVAVMVLIAVGDSIHSLATVVSYIAGSDERRAEREKHQAESKLKQVARENEQQATEDDKAELERLADELFVAAYGDFDAAKRDEIADKIVGLKARTKGSRVDIERVFFDAGAHDKLLEEKPGTSKMWYRAAVLGADWDRIKGLSVKTDQVYSATAARAFCLAGDQGKALGVFKWLLEKNPFERNLVADAVACGATEENLDVGLFAKPSRPIAEVAAARSMIPELERVYRGLARDRKQRGSTALMEAAAVLFMADKLEAKELSAVSQVRRWCGADRWQAHVAESAPSATLFDAAARLESAEVDDKEARGRAVENLRVAGMVAGLSRGEDLRDGLVVRLPHNEMCMALAEYVLEPAAAERRLKKMLKSSDKPNGHAHTMLAMTHARLGDFDAAFGQAQKVLELSKPNKGSRSDGNLMVLAFAHRAGRLEEAVLVEPRDPVAEALSALRASEQEQRTRRGIRTSRWGFGGPPPVAFYLRAALAPGHEEAFLDGFDDPNSSLSGYMWSRAEAARWRGDADAEQSWLARRRALYERATDGAFGGARILHVRL